MTNHVASALLWPRPRCCDAIQRWPIVHAAADIPDDGVPRCRWTWHAFHLSGERYEPPGGGGVSLWRAPRPTHCPFCQTQLPELTLREPAPVTCDPGDYYCGTCEERLEACECLPFECRWEVQSLPRPNV